MARMILFCVSAVLAVGATLVLAAEGADKPKVKCGENMKFNECGSHCPRNCSTVDVPAIPCDRRCVARCVCNDNFVVDDYTNNRCVPEKLCRSCQGNTRYSTCGSECPATCDNRAPQNCGGKCMPGCVCKDGYILTGARSGICILPSKCRSARP